VARGETIRAEAVIATPALPIIADFVEEHVCPDYVADLRRIRYLASVMFVAPHRRTLESRWQSLRAV
ncbi:MAG: hypothetical protein P8Z33_13905, partial [Gammaproteobacteria bacterium]